MIWYSSRQRTDRQEAWCLKLPKTTTQTTRWPTWWMNVLFEHVLLCCCRLSALKVGDLENKMVSTQEDLEEAARQWEEQLGAQTCIQKHKTSNLIPFWICNCTWTAHDMVDFSNIEAICSWSRSWWVQAALWKVPWRIVCECLILFVEPFWTWMQDQTGPNPGLPSVPLDPWMSTQVLSSPRARDGRTWGHTRYCRRSGALLSLLSAVHSQIHIHSFWEVYIYTILLRRNVYVSFTATKMFFLESAT